MIGGVGVASQGFDDEGLLDDVVEAVGDTGEEAGGGADEPTERTGFVVTSVGGFFFLFFFFLVFVFFSLRLFLRCGLILICFWLRENRGRKDV